MQNMSINRNRSGLRILVSALTILASGLLVAPSRPALAQGGGYQVGESGATDPATTAANATAGPVRMARFSFIQGSVTWRASEDLDWATAPDNLPLRQGAQIWVANGGRAEIQFDDGSYLRLGGGAIATLQMLFSDDQGEFTQIKQTNGLSMLTVKHSHSVYQVDTPLLSMKTTGPSRVRVGVSEGSEVGVVEGGASVEAGQGKESLAAGDYLNLASASSPFVVRALPRADSWELWNEERDALLSGAAARLSQQGVPENISMVAGDLDSYGSWRNDATYGNVWCPRVADSGWRPYYAGHWAWVNPFGWTWVSDEPWGWAPYHYGTWFHASYGWAWRPGPREQYWCPAVVHFTESNGAVAWCPLAPSEVRYPATIGLGFRGGNWALYFSIGQAACYYPGGPNYCVARPFNTVVINKVTYVNNVTVINNGARGGVGFTANNNRYLTARNFVPVNARVAGVTSVVQSGFGGRGSYQTVSSGAALFTNGRTISAPPVGSAPAAGPSAIRPTVNALVPGRTFVRAAAETPNVARRPIFHDNRAVGTTLPGGRMPTSPVDRAREAVRTPADPNRTVRDRPAGGPTRNPGDRPVGGPTRNPGDRPVGGPTRNPGGNTGGDNSGGGRSTGDRPVGGPTRNPGGNSGGDRPTGGGRSTGGDRPTGGPTRNSGGDNNNKGDRKENSGGDN